MFCTFGPVQHDNPKLRRIRTALWSMARKNGKTALTAALVLVFLVGPEAQPNGSVMSAASDREQAGHVYKACAQMIRADEELSQLCKCLDSVKRIVCYHLGSTYQSLAAIGRRQHGGNPVLCIYDELAQAADRELYDVLTSQFGAQSEGLFLAISTQSPDVNSPMGEMVADAIMQEQGLLDDDTFYGRVYRVPDDADPFDESVWPLANPALGDMLVTADMRSAARKARRSPSALSAFKNLRLNMAVDATATFLSRAAWDACPAGVADEKLRSAPAFGGLDLSLRRDLCAYVVTFDLPDGTAAVKCWFWLPSKNLEEKEKEDGAHYLSWAEDGYITLIDGEMIDFDRVVRDVASINAGLNLKAVGFDQYRIDQFKAAAARGELDISAWNMQPVGQSARDMSPCIDLLEANVVDRRLRHGKNPVLTYCVSNVRPLTNTAGERRFDKRKKNRRIDGAVALAMAEGMRAKFGNGSRKGSYLDRMALAVAERDIDRRNPSPRA